MSPDSKNEGVAQQAREARTLDDVLESMRLAHKQGWVEEIRAAVSSLTVERDTLRDALADDASGRPFHELLTVAADLLYGYGGGPVEDCLRLKAADVLAAASGNPSESGGHCVCGKTMTLSEDGDRAYPDRADDCPVHGNPSESEPA